MDIDKKISQELRNKVILVTGGAGSIGTALTKKLLQYPVKSVRVLDIDEHALFKLSRSLNNPKLRILLGSILDEDRLAMAGDNVDIVFHLAAIKNIEITESNPIETVDVNINGTINLIKMAVKNKPKKFVNISTDKAAEPTTLYGTTKQLGERLTTWAGDRSGTKFATVRFGNVIETRGNVFEVWNEELNRNTALSITDPSMKRYFFHISEAVNFILKCLLLTNNGEIFIPKMELYNIKEMANKVSKKHKIIGLRAGEKLNEVLITDVEKKHAIEKNDMWIVKQPN